MLEPDDEGATEAGVFGATQPVDQTADDPLDVLGGGGILQPEQGSNGVGQARQVGFAVTPLFK